MKSITIEVAANGEVTIEGHGFKGADCEKATKAMEEALGVAKNRKKKPDYYQHEVKTQRS